MTVLHLGRGRPRKPTATKALQGTLRKGRVNPAEPRGTLVAIPDAPADLLTDDERAAWELYRGLVDPLKVATASDLEAFRAMVEDAALLRTLRRSYYVEGGGKPTYVEDTKAGLQLRQRPEPNMIATYRKVMFLHWARWGLTAADRSKVSALTDEKPKEDKLAKFRLSK